MLGTRILSNKTRRKDFISLLVQKVHEGQVEKEELAAHVSTLAYVLNEIGMIETVTDMDDLLALRVGRLFPHHWLARPSFCYRILTR